MLLKFRKPRCTLLRRVFAQLYGCFNDNRLNTLNDNSGRILEFAVLRIILRSRGNQC